MENNFVKFNLIPFPFDNFFVSDPVENLGYIFLWGFSDFIQNYTWNAQNEGQRNDSYHSA